MSISRSLVRVKETPSERVRLFVEHQLRTKAWVPGTLLPLAPSLREQFPPHRLIVHRILITFVLEGHLVRKPGIGTVVSAAPVTMAELSHTIALITCHSFDVEANIFLGAIQQTNR